MARRILSSRWWLAAMVAVTIALRVAHILALRQTPWFDHLVVDPEYYDAWARQIATGRWLGDGLFYMDPLYPYVLAVLYRVAGRDLLLARLLNVACSAGTCLLVAYIGRVIGGRAAGGLAALGFALYAPDVFATGELDKTSLSILLTALALALALGRSPAARAGAGMATAAGAFTRANLLAFVPLGALAFFFDPESKRRRAASAIAYFAGAALVLGPVLWRNHYVGHEWVLTTTQLGQNFYTGNNPSNPWGAYGVVPFVRPHPRFEEVDFRTAAEQRTGRSMTAPEVSRFWFAEAWAHIRSDPWFASRAFARKLFLFWNDFEISDSQDQYLIERFSPPLRLPLLGFGAVLPFALLGAVATAAGAPVVGIGRPRRQRWNVALLSGFVLIYCATLVAFFLFARYRMPVVVAVLPLAAVGVLAMTRRVLARVGVVPAVAVLVVAGVVTFMPVHLFRRDHPVTIEMRLRHLAAMYVAVGQTDEAIAALKEAIVGCPPGCPWALADLFELYRRSGRQAEGLTWFRPFVAAHPQQADAPDYVRRLAAEVEGTRLP